MVLRTRDHSTTFEEDLILFMVSTPSPLTQEAEIYLTREFVKAHFKNSSVYVHRVHSQQMSATSLHSWAIIDSIGAEGRG